MCHFILTFHFAPHFRTYYSESVYTADTIFKSLSEGRIYLMPSVKAVDQIWVPAQTLMGDMAKDAYRSRNGETQKYSSEADVLAALQTVNKNIYDAVYTLSE